MAKKIGMRGVRRIAAALVGFFGLSLAPCQAQYAPREESWASQSSGSRAARATGPTGPSRPGDFDYYVFSLSWSPGFCATHFAEGKAQCGDGSRFVTHGLWPQYERGFPQDCGRGGRSSLPSGALAEADGLFPDERLARYEWRKHGTCSGDAPQDYFRNVKKARAKIVIPQQFARESNAQRMPPDEIARAFMKENPGLNADETAVVCQSGVFQEIRFCLTKNLESFRACPEVASHSCRARAIQIPTP